MLQFAEEIRTKFQSCHHNCKFDTRPSGKWCACMMMTLNSSPSFFSSMDFQPEMQFKKDVMLMRVRGENLRHEIAGNLVRRSLLKTLLGEEEFFKCCRSHEMPQNFFFDPDVNQDLCQKNRSCQSAKNRKFAPSGRYQHLRASLPPTCFMFLLFSGMLPRVEGVGCPDF